MATTNKFQEKIEKHLIDFKSKRQYLPPTNRDYLEFCVNEI